MRRVEAVLWEHAADSFLAQHPEAEACNSGDAFATNSGYFERLQRVVNGCERNYHRALKELQRLEVARGHALRTPQSEAEPPADTESAPQPEPSKPTSTSSASVRSNPKTPPPAAPQPPVVAPDAPPFASPLASQHVPPSPAESQPSPSNRFPTPDEAIDAALQAISKESSPER